MKVIATTDLSKEGNDCYIYKSVSLVKEFDMYAIIETTKIVGWSERQEMICHSEITEDFKRAKVLYKKAGGKDIKEDTDYE